MGLPLVLYPLCKKYGKEPNEVNPLSLVKLNHPNQRMGQARFALENGYVDLGAYRYILANRNNDYRLYGQPVA